MPHSSAVAVTSFGPRARPPAILPAWNRSLPIAIVTLSCFACGYKETGVSAIRGACLALLKLSAVLQRSEKESCHEDMSRTSQGQFAGIDSTAPFRGWPGCLYERPVLLRGHQRS